MARNGFGTYTLPAGNPVVTGTTISSTVQNNTLADIAAALTASIANDGQTPATANLPMASFRHTNVGAAASATDYLRADQGQNSSLQYLSSIAGTNTITGSASVLLAAYAAGQAFRFVAAGANTGAVTLNVDGLGAKAVTKNGTTALAAGDIPSGAAVEVIYDGTRFQLVNIPIPAPIPIPTDSLVPAGAVAYLARNTAPSGWLKANGAAVSRTTYSALFTAIGTTFGAGDGSTTFNVPDLRGEFVRSWSDGRGVDNGRVFGSAQAQDIQPHTHNIVGSNTGGSGSRMFVHPVDVNAIDTGSTQSAGTTETRPRNVALLACIKF